MRIRPRVLALLAAPALLLAACGGGDDGGTRATTPPQPAKVTVTATASGKQVTFDLPAQLKQGATQLELVNNTKEPAELQIVQLDGGHTLAGFYPVIETEEAAPIPSWLHAFGGVGETSAGQRRSVVVDLKPGKYSWFSGTSPEQEGAKPQYRRRLGSPAAGDPGPDHGQGARPDQLPVRGQRVQGRHQPDHLPAPVGQLRPDVLPHRPGR